MCSSPSKISRCAGPSASGYVLFSMLQIAFYSKMGRNERPPRVGVNLIDVLAQDFPAQLFRLRSWLLPATPPKLLFVCRIYVCIVIQVGPVMEASCRLRSEPKLWGRGEDEGEKMELRVPPICWL